MHHSLAPSAYQQVLVESDLSRPRLHSVSSAGQSTEINWTAKFCICFVSRCGTVCPARNIAEQNPPAAPPAILAPRRLQMG